jgi:hypothetical protein
MSAPLLLRKLALKLLHIFCTHRSDAGCAASLRHLTATVFKFGTCFHILCQTQSYPLPILK